MFSYLFCFIFLYTVQCYGEPIQCTRENEILDCVSVCPPQKTCMNRDIAFRCREEVTPCRSECVCKKGFFRNSFFDCILEEDCPTCHGENEYYSCGSSCDNVCATLHEMNQTNCPYVNIRCNDLCYCKEGYARDGDNKCIPIQDCPGTSFH